MGSGPEERERGGEVGGGGGGETLGGEMKEKVEKKSIRERWQQRREGGHKSHQPIPCAPIVHVCVRVCVKSQVSASRLITIHTLANGDKVSNPVHNMSLAHFRPNGDIPRSHTRCLSKCWTCPSQ